jgi:glycosidase
MSTENRAKWMRNAFGEAYKAFVTDTLPLGSTLCSQSETSNGNTLFVTIAPHAVTASVSILSPGAPSGDPSSASSSAAGAVQRFPMSLTPDLHYWWCEVPSTVACHMAGYYYTFNGVDNVLDPAAKDMHNLHLLNQGQNGRIGIEVYSQVVDSSLLRDIANKGINWDTMAWSYHITYQLHPLRLALPPPKVATRSVAPLDDDEQARIAALTPPAFDRVSALLQPGAYLDKLPVTSLELLPVHEFAGWSSWGYDPCAFFGVEETYGGPEGLARLVAASHKAGKGIILDAVVNHLGWLSPLSNHHYRDSFISGNTAWGQMLRYCDTGAEHLTQALVHLFETYRVDGLRFDCCKAITLWEDAVQYVVGSDFRGEKTVGIGGGADFLRSLRDTLNAAAGALGIKFPYLVSENGTVYRDKSYRILSGQWDIEGGFYDRCLQLCETGKDFAAYSVEENFKQTMSAVFDVKFAESHDGVSGQDIEHVRVAARRDDCPFSIAKAAGALSILSPGVPMVFMGQEIAEQHNFFFDFWLAKDYRLRHFYVDPVATLAEEEAAGGSDKKTVLQWFTDLIALRKDNHPALSPPQVTCSNNWGHMMAFTFKDNYFVIVTMGNKGVWKPKLADLNMPNGAWEIIMSSCSQPYRTSDEKDGVYHPPNYEYTNNRSDANGEIYLPAVGAIIFRRTKY